VALGRVVSAQRVLCVNAGSSSLRVTLAERAADGSLREVARATVERIGGESLIADDAGERPVSAPDHAAALDRVLELAAMGGTPAAIGHRLVHGGPSHDGPALLDGATLAELDRWRPLAPLHLPIALELVATTGARFPGVPQVGCFDTAFGSALPNTARRLPIPAALDEAGLHRYGFHGLSYESVLDRLGADALGRAVLAHLGAGASLAAVVDGRPVHTTMGLTPSGGTVMATRPGDLDPGLLVYLVEQGMDGVALRRLVDHESGLAGISGGTGDMRELLVEREHVAAAALAVEIFCRSAAMHAAACTAVLGGLDSLVFTGGIGEHSPVVRAEVCQRLEHLGVQLDPERNERGAGVISASESVVTVHAVPSDEESVIARETASVVLG
jgi:acetate kinase